MATEISRVLKLAVPMAANEGTARLVVTVRPAAMVIVDRAATVATVRPAVTGTAGPSPHRRSSC